MFEGHTTEYIQCNYFASKANENYGGRMGEGIIRGFGMDMYTLLYLKWITTRTCCIAQETAQGYVAAWMGGSVGENADMSLYG